LQEVGLQVALLRVLPGRRALSREVQVLRLPQPRRQQPIGALAAGRDQAHDHRGPAGSGQASASWPAWCDARATRLGRDERRACTCLARQVRQAAQLHKFDWRRGSGRGRCSGRWSGAEHGGASSGGAAVEATIGSDLTGGGAEAEDSTESAVGSTEVDSDDGIGRIRRGLRRRSQRTQ
jgi:hypothetical protein